MHYAAILQPQQQSVKGEDYVHKSHSLQVLVRNDIYCPLSEPDFSPKFSPLLELVTPAAHAI